MSNQAGVQSGVSRSPLGSAATLEGPSHPIRRTGLRSAVKGMTAWLDRVLYPSFGCNWDDERFRAAILEDVCAETDCLDYGAGRGNVRQMNFRGIARRVAGIDPEPEVHDNPHLDESGLLDLQTGRIPYPDAAFDLVFADNVMEHVEDPDQVFCEIQRVLRPGGRFLAKTPNKWHYMPTIARSTPTWFHRFYNRLRGRDVVDTFPTTYQCNTRAAVVKSAAVAGLVVRNVQFIEGRPEYLRITPPTYVCGWLYERLVNSSRLFEGFRCVMIFELQKPPST